MSIPNFAQVAAIVGKRSEMESRPFPL